MNHVKRQLRKIRKNIVIPAVMNVSVIVFPNQEEITHRVKYGTLIFLQEEGYRPSVPLVILNILQPLPKYSNNNLILFVDILKV